MGNPTDPIPSRFEPGIAPDRALSSCIRARIAGTPAPTTCTRSRILIALIVVAGAAAVVVAIASQVVYHRQAMGIDVRAHSFATLALELLSIVALVVAATFAALNRRGPASSVTSPFIAAALVAPLYGLVILASPLHADHLFPSPVVLSPWGARCIMLAAVVGALVLVGFTAALRRAIPVASRVRGAALGAAAGAWAGLVVFIFCPAGTDQHLVLGHVLPVLAFTLIGTIAIPRLLRT